MDLKSLVKKLFIVMVFFACFTCYSRADYNLPLFAFAYLLWDVEKPYSQKTRLTFLFIFSWIIDLTWLIYWGPFWDSSVFDQNWAKGVQTFVLVLSVINFLIKLGAIILVFLTEREVMNSFTPEGFMKNLRHVFGMGPGVDDHEYNK